MKKLILISVLLFSFNGWGNDDYDKCIAIVEETRDIYLEERDWSLEEENILRLESLIERSADVARRVAKNESDMSPATSTMGGKWMVGLNADKRGQLAYDEKRAKLEIELGINELKMDLERRKADWADESRRLANRSYLEGLEVCIRLKE